MVSPAVPVVYYAIAVVQATGFFRRIGLSYDFNTDIVQRENST
jgi:hypothetical protein